MEKIVEKGLLYDFYGELLTDHQKSIYEDAVYNDMSLSEIAEQHQITRQGVHDLLKRCDKILQEYESKLHLVDKFICIQKKAHEISQILDQSGQEPQYSFQRKEMERMKELTNGIIEEL